jgi:hypothetical protein
VDRHCTTRPSASWLGLRLTMATHCDHATNMLITSQHVSIVESIPLKTREWHPPRWIAIALPEWGFQAWLYPEETMATRSRRYVSVD